MAELAPQDRPIVLAAAAAGFVCVAAGAFAAHAVEDATVRDWLRTGATYGFVHLLAAVAAVILSHLGLTAARRAALAFLPGVLVFTGSLILMALGAPRWFGAITPIGGVLFLAGWVLLGWSAVRRPPQA